MVQTEGGIIRERSKEREGERETDRQREREKKQGCCLPACDACRLLPPRICSPPHLLFCSCGIYYHTDILCVMCFVVCCHLPFLSHVHVLACSLCCVFCCLLSLTLSHVYLTFFVRDRFVSTRLRHLRLSPDGTTLVVKSEKGGVDHELALDELLEVLSLLHDAQGLGDRHNSRPPSNDLNIYCGIIKGSTFYVQVFVFKTLNLNSTDKWKQLFTPPSPPARARLFTLAHKRQQTGARNPFGLLYI